MTRVLYVLGAPGVGKTTLMDSLLAPYDRDPYTRLVNFGAFGYEPLRQRGEFVGVHLGRARESFGGTDALAFSVLPNAVNWAASTVLPPLIFGEGARLAHPRFLLALKDRGADVRVVHLTAHPARVAQRCRERGSKQDEVWRRGATTRALNAFLALVAAGLPHVQLDTTHLTPEDVTQTVLTEALEPLTP